MTCPLTPPCTRVECPQYLPPVGPGRRLAACAEVIGDVAVVFGGLSQSDCAWYLGATRDVVRGVEKRALVKLRRGVSQ